MRPQRLNPRHRRRQGLQSMVELNVVLRPNPGPKPQVIGQRERHRDQRNACLDRERRPVSWNTSRPRATEHRRRTARARGSEQLTGRPPPTRRAKKTSRAGRRRLHGQAATISRAEAAVKTGTRRSGVALEARHCFAPLYCLQREFMRGGALDQASGSNTLASSPSPKKAA